MFSLEPKDNTPRFTVGDVVWVCPSNNDTGWFNGVVAHILRYDEPLQNGVKPGFDGNLYIVEISTHVDPYFDMFPSGRLHHIPHCRRNSTMVGEHECRRDVQSEINAIDAQIARIEHEKLMIVQADSKLDDLRRMREELEKKL